ncbi:MAG: hypothetical protein ACYSSO_03745 [Planctomycetota bacterium]|jgi:chromosome segregation ATPase
MQVTKKIMLLIINILLIFLLSACTITKEPGKLTLQSSPVQHVQQNTEQPPPNSVAKRFEESASKGPTTLESAIELSQKHAKLSKQVVVLQQENQDLISENHHLNEQLAANESQLQQAQKELDEANDLLIETRIELNNWKVDVLSFRDEMRDAGSAQLQALLKILTVLGGEVKPESNQTEETPLAEAPQSQNYQSQTRETLTLGESNE